MIGASASELMARMRLAPLQPAMCCVAPEIPHAMYSSGAILVPVWPTWSEWGRQPALVTTREQPTAPPSRPASSSMMANPSFEPTPRPPLTTTFASASDTPPAGGATCSETLTIRSRLSSSSMNLLTSASIGAGPCVTRNVYGATVMSGRGLWRAAVSSRLPPHRLRTRPTGFPGVAAVGAGGEHGRHIEVVGAALKDRRDRIGCEGLDRIGMHSMKGASPRPRECQCLQRGLAVLHQNQDAQTRPMSRSISTTAGAAGGPKPSALVWRPGPPGTTRSISRSRDSGRAGEEVATGLRPARMRPGTDG